MNNRRYTQHKSVNRLRWIYIIADLLVAVAVWILFLFIRWAINEDQAININDAVIRSITFYTPLILFPLLSIFIHYMTGYYQSLTDISRMRETGKTFISSLLLTLLLYFFCVLNDIVKDYHSYYHFLLILFILQFTLSLFTRIVVSTYRRRLYRRGLLAKRTLIIGDKKDAQPLYSELQTRPNDFLLLGRVALRADDSDDAIGHFDNISSLLTDNEVHSVVIALPDNYLSADLFRLIDHLYRFQVEIQFTPRLYEVLTGTVHIHRPDISPLVNISRLTMSDWQQCVKRAFDITSSALALIITLPLTLFCIVRIRLDGHGPIIYRQERIGMYGHPFNILKFRTMRTDAEKDGTPHLSLKNDPRITSYGRWMRRYRIDEIPQFINVIRGDMSIVGYRPERKYFIDQIMQQAPYYCMLYKTRPGITSWGPIKIGYTQDINAMIRRLNYDIIYIESMSIAEDLRIMFYTIRVIANGKGQ